MVLTAHNIISYLSSFIPCFLTDSLLPSSSSSACGRYSRLLCLAGCAPPRDLCKSLVLPGTWCQCICIDFLHRRPLAVSTIRCFVVVPLDNFLNHFLQTVHTMLATDLCTNCRHRCVHVERCKLFSESHVRKLIPQHQNFCGSKFVLHQLISQVVGRLRYICVC